MLIFALAIAASSPAEEELKRELIPCREAVIAAVEGDDGFLDRYLIGIKADRQRSAELRARCAVYVQGAIDGAMIERLEASRR